MWSAGYQAGAAETCVCLSLSPVVSRPPHALGQHSCTLVTTKQSGAAKTYSLYKCSKCARFIFAYVLKCCYAGTSTSGAARKLCSTDVGRQRDVVSADPSFHETKCDRTICLITFFSSKKQMYKHSFSTSTTRCPPSKGHHFSPGKLHSSRIIIPNFYGIGKHT